MFTSKKSFTDTRAIVYALVILLVLTGFKFGYLTLPMGLFFGVAFSSIWRVSTEGDDVPLALALLVIAAGLALLAWALVVAQANGVSLDDIHQVQGLGRFTRSLAFRALSTVVAGCFLVLANLIVKNAPDDAGAE
jgi:hypothetical protein